MHTWPRRGLQLALVQALSTPSHSLSPPKLRLAASRALPLPREEQRALGAPRPGTARLLLRDTARSGSSTLLSRPAGRPHSALQTPQQINHRAALELLSSAPDTLG